MRCAGLRIMLVGAGLLLSGRTAWAQEGRAAPSPQSQPAHDEALWLANIRQLTSTEQGLARAGEAYFSADARRVSFQAFPAGKQDYQIYVMGLDGTGLKMVSTGAGACTCSYFHPSGEKLLFASNHEDLREPTPAQMEPIRHSRPDPEKERNDASPAGGGRPHGPCLDEPPGGKPGGHPGGGKPGEAPRHGGRGYAWKYYPGMEIYEYTFSTGALKRLTHSDGYDAEGAYSPDGKRIVFSSFRDGQQKIYLANADGAEVRRISNGPGDGGPFFSPDGRQVVYRGDRTGNGNMQIFVNDLEGAAERQLTQEDGSSHWCPYWHPSGKWIAYTQIRRGRFDVYVMRADGSEVRRVTSEGEWNGLPVFSPDAKKLMWTSRRGGIDAPQIFIADCVGLTAEGELRGAK